MRAPSLVGAIVCSASSIAFAAPAGRVVRVERGAARALVPALCQLDGSDGARCYFHKPDVGDTLTVFNKEGVVGELRIVESNDSTTCESSGWAVEIAPLRNSAVPTRHVDDIAVTNMHLDPALARISMTSHRPASSNARVGDEEVMVAIDGDGDGKSDLEMSQYACDADNKPISRQSRSPHVGTCVALWLADRDGWQRVGQFNNMKPCP